MNARRTFLALALLVLPGLAAGADDPAVAWPEVTNTAKPWTYWWWMASAVDPANITRELTRYRDAGLGGVHIIPIYGAKGYEDRSIEYLSPRWMEMLLHTVTEAKRFGLGVDMTLGSGWCFGGPDVAPRDANARVVSRTYQLRPGARFAEKIDREATQALVAFPERGEPVDLLGKVAADGSVDWSAGDSPCIVYAVSQRFSGQKVKRAAPGGDGPMLNPFSGDATRRYLERFTRAFDAYVGPLPRAIYHDSYEYQNDWSPDFLREFERRRGYRLEDHLPKFLGKDEDDTTARLKHDYRLTASDLMTDGFTRTWVDWGHARGMIARDEAHGSPANLLDLYAAADVPETEFFFKDRNPLVAKFASSAAHVAGRPLVSSESGTWLAEHFQVTLADLKHLMDDFFVSGVNHVFYHGTCYSPDEAGYPGWLFYASTDMNPRDAIWHDAPALNTYIARCQSVLQSGRPDNDVLVYWPVADLWSDPKGMAQTLTVHHTEWLTDQSVGKLAERLWRWGYQFDYVSDRQLAAMDALPAPHKAVAVPRCAHMPPETFDALVRLARSGATVVFESMPGDVPGLGDLGRRRTALRQAIERLPFKDTFDAGRVAVVGKGTVVENSVEATLSQLRIVREELVDHPGVRLIRRATPAGRDFFIAHHGERPLDGWFTIGTRARSAVLMDPVSGRIGGAEVQTPALEDEPSKVRLRLEPGESVILRTFTDRQVDTPPSPVFREGSPGGAKAIDGNVWTVEFLEGGPERLEPRRSTGLGSWATEDDPKSLAFAGTARYSTSFDAPSDHAGPWWVDLGKVCQSARVRLNGVDLGTCFAPPFRVVAAGLKPRGNLIEIEVTNLSANRIRDLDRRKVAWRTFHDINFVNIAYKPFDASDWPVAESGLLGPVTLRPAGAGR
jgi:hypothetical protein